MLSPSKGATKEHVFRLWTAIRLLQAYMNGKAIEFRANSVYLFIGECSHYICISSLHPMCACVCVCARLVWCRCSSVIDELKKLNCVCISKAAIGDCISSSLLIRPNWIKIELDRKKSRLLVVTSFIGNSEGRMLKSSFLPNIKSGWTINRCAAPLLLRWDIWLKLHLPAFHFDLQFYRIDSSNLHLRGEGKIHLKQQTKDINKNGRECSTYENFHALLISVKSMQSIEKSK